MGLQELFEEVSSLLRGHGYAVERIRYPYEHRRRSIDVVAVRGPGEQSLLLKIVDDLEDLSGSDYRELASCSRVLGAAGLVVAAKEHGDEIDPMVAVERGGTYAVSPEGLRTALEGSIYVVKRQSSYYMRVDGERLREARVRKGYSLGDVASRASVSRRSIYLYEQDESMVSLPVALRLMEMFGDEIFKPFDIIGEQLRRDERLFAAISQSSSKAQVARILASMGYSVASTRRIPPDVVASKREGEARKRVVIVTERRRDTEFETRLAEAERIARRLRARVIAFSKSGRRVGMVEVVESVEELRLALGEDEG